jgi:flagellar basal-body rod modification protein FlgD
LEYQTQTGTDLAMLVVRDARGAIVQQIPVPPEGGRVIWDGVDETGAPLPAGLYDLSVDAFQGDALLGRSAVQTQARIVEARLSGGTTVLVMEHGPEVAAGDIRALRAPGA